MIEIPEYQTDWSRLLEPTELKAAYRTDTQALHSTLSDERATLQHVRAALAARDAQRAEVKSVVNQLLQSQEAMEVLMMLTVVVILF